MIELFCALLRVPVCGILPEDTAERILEAAADI
jgi:hypothetical protein